MSNVTPWLNTHAYIRWQGLVIKWSSHWISPGVMTHSCLSFLVGLPKIGHRRINQVHCERDNLLCVDWTFSWSFQVWSIYTFIFWYQLVKIKLKKSMQILSVSYKVIKYSLWVKEVLLCIRLKLHHSTGVSWHNIYWNSDSVTMEFTTVFISTHA